jgi:hypothetical protein
MDNEKAKRKVMIVGLADIRKILRSKQFTDEQKVKMITKIVESVGDMG